MGKPTPGGQELAVAITGALAALNDVTPSASFIGDFNIEVSGTFVGSVVLDRSFDGGTTWTPCSALGTVVGWTAPATETLRNFEQGVLYRLRRNTFTSGTVNARLSQ